MKIISFFLLVSLTTVAQTLNPQRSWGTYFGDERYEYQESIVDKLGNLYIVGAIVAENQTTQVFTTPNTYQAIYGGGQSDGFIAKFNNLGQLTWMSYFGGEGMDGISAIDVDSENNIYIAGFTDSTTNIATTGAYQSSFGGGIDFFVARFTPSGSLDWSSYFGGANGEGDSISSILNHGIDQKRIQIAHDKFNHFYISGRTEGTGMGTAGTFQPNKEQSQYSISKFSNTGTRVWTTYYGIYSHNLLHSLTCNNEAVYVSGQTFECNTAQTPYNTYFGTLGAYNAIPNNCSDTFLSKFDTNGQREWSTYYGGQSPDYSSTNALKTYQDKVYLAGQGAGSSLATTGTFQETTPQNFSSPFLVQFTQSGTRDWGTFNGLTVNQNLIYGANNNHIIIDESGAIIESGTIGLNTNVASVGAYQSTLKGNLDGYIAKFDATGQKIWGTYYGGTSNESEMIAHPYASNVYVVGTTTSYTEMTTPGALQPNITLFDSETGYKKNIFIAYFTPRPLATETFDTLNSSLYPNPTNDKVSMDNSTAHYQSIAVYNYLGQEMIQQKLTFSNNQTIDLSGFSKGVYLFKLQSDNSTKTIKVIKK